LRRRRVRYRDTDYDRDERYGFLRGERHPR
jgi:hypothetical protein